MNDQNDSNDQNPDADLDYTVPAVVEAAEPPLVSVRTRRTIRFNWGALFALLLLGVVLYLVAGGAFPPEARQWWPVAIIGTGVLWAFGALARRNAAGWIGAGGLIGIGVAALLATAFNVVFSSTVVGVTLLTLGAAIILRSFLFAPPLLRD